MVMTDRDYDSEDRAYLSGHYFLAVPGSCEGCHRDFDELVREARAAADDFSVCPTPHADAEVGQVMHIGPRPK